ncbi:MAG: hypothetical protein ACJ74U_18285 [Jatrophihabitantaceae bacterium]
MSLLAAALPVLADSDTGKGSPIGLLVVLLLLVAVYFLYRSMNRHLRKVPGQFDQPEPPTAQPSAAQPPNGEPPAAQPSVAEPSAGQPSERQPGDPS